MKFSAIAVPFMAAAALAAPSADQLQRRSADIEAEAAKYEVEAAEWAAAYGSRQLENGHEKRQAFVTPPDGCEDEDAFAACTYREAYFCLIPNGPMLAYCRAHCAGCCGSTDGVPDQGLGYCP